jgi:hypothetical protein
MIKQYIERFARYGGVGAVLLEWSALLIFYIRAPAEFSGQHPISYFATLPQTRLVFSICYGLAAVSYWLFASWHLSKHYRTPTKLFALSLLGFAAMAIVPFDPTNVVSNMGHSIFVSLFSATFITAIYLMAKGNDDPELTRASMIAVLLSLLLTLSFLLVQRDSRAVLLLEASAGLVGQLWTIWLTYHISKKIRWARSRKLNI